MKIKVMTFNLRTESKGDGVNYFPNRRGRILNTINEQSPDIIGFQEATDTMRGWLTGALDGYTVVGCGRGRDCRGEATIIAFHPDRLELMRAETFWLSLTPDIPGSSYGLDQSRCPRIATAALMRHKEGGAPFVFCNTHLDHKGKTARLLGSAQLMQYLSSQPHRFILTGDFNATPDTPEITLLTSSADFPVADATANLSGTFHGFGQCLPSTKIDYIFTNLPFDMSESFVVADEPGEDGVYISDHNPVCALIELI